MKRKKKKKHHPAGNEPRQKWLGSMLLIAVPLFALLAITVIALNFNYPQVGHDFKYQVSRLIDTHIHYLKNGFSIQWWTPAFGGGLPSYPNPLQVQFSLVQLLTYFFNPWTAINFYICFFYIAGYFGSYLFFRSLFGFSRHTSVLGSVLFLVTGFQIQHLSVGHLNFLPLLLIPLIIMFLYDDRLPMPIASLLVALILTLTIHAAGFYCFFIFAFAIAICLIILFLYRDQDRTARFAIIRRIAFKSGLGMLIFAALSLSKIVAVQSFMRFFQREITVNSVLSLPAAIGGVFAQLFFTPVAKLLQIDCDLYMKKFLGVNLGLWELDIGLSPVFSALMIFFIITAACNSTGESRTALRARIQDQWQLLALLVLLFWIVLEMSMAKGYLYGFIKSLPVFKSFSNSVRFTVTVALPAITLLLIRYSRFEQTVKMANRTTAILIAAMLALYSVYIIIPGKTTGGRKYHNMNIRPSIKFWDQINTKYPDYTIVKHLDIPDEFTHLLKATNDRFTYEPIFDMKKEFNIKTERKKPANLIIDGRYFNMTNPASLVYPEENGLARFALISTNDKNNFDNFVSYRPTTWQLSVAQEIANAVSLIAVAMSTLVLAGYGLRAYKKSRKKL